MRRAFLDILKVFDKVWNDGLIFKLKSYGVAVELLLLLKNYLFNREQRVVLNGQTWLEKDLFCSSTGTSIRFPFAFNLYQWLPNGINSMGKIFADDTSFFSKVLDINKSVIELNADFKRMK